MSRLNVAENKTCDTLSVEWVETAAEIYQDDQLAFVEAITPFYRRLMAEMSPRAVPVMAVMCGFYGNPVTTDDLEHAFRSDKQYMAEQLNELISAGVVEERDGQYSISDPNLIRYTTIRYDGCGLELWRKDNKEFGLDSVVDKYIEHQRAKNKPRHF